MQTFRKIAGFVIVNICMFVMFTFMLAQPSALKILLKEAKSNDFNVIIIGESHGETGLNPFVISEVIDNEVINLSRRLMPVVNLSYILEEANVNGQYKTVILEIDPSYWNTDHKGLFGSDTHLLFRLTGIRWLSYVKNILLKDNYNDALADYKVSSLDIKKIQMNLKCRLNRNYWQCNESAIQSIYATTGVSSNFEYKGRGFRYGLKKSGVEWSNWRFDKNNIKEENVQAFYTIVKYCSDNNIKLICVQSALPPYRLQKENMGEVHEYFTELCNNCGIPFYDMNYLKKEYLSRTDDDYVDLDGHMMGELANRQSTILGRILVSDDTDIFFYSTYSEVLHSLE